MIEAKKEVIKFERKNNSGPSELLNAILGDAPLRKELKKLGVADEEIPDYVALLSSYLESRNYCEKCPGLVDCHASTPGMCRTLTILDSGRLGSFFGPCPKAIQRTALLKNYLFRDFPDEWLSNTLRSFRNVRAKTVRNALGTALKDKLHPWAYLTGSQGAGKSYFMSAFTNDIALNGDKVAFLNSNRRFDELKGLAIKDKTAFDKTLSKLSACSLLVIDDFGSEYKSDYVRDQIVLPLLVERSKGHKITFFGSDYSLDEIYRLYSTSVSSSIQAKRLVEIIRQNIRAETIVPPGVDSFLQK